MANKKLFGSDGRGKLAPKTDTVNAAGGRAYSFSDKHALAQYVATGCLNDTFYASGGDQLEVVMKLAMKLDAEFVAKAAVYSRKIGFMKDMPALLMAILSTKDITLFKKVFHTVIDNGKMMRNFVQIIRSGVVGRKSLGSAPKRMIQEWFNLQSDKRLLSASVGNDPSLADVMHLVHPRPSSKEREALHNYILKRDYNVEVLPQVAKDLERFKKEGGEVPEVPFQMLTALDLSKEDWTNIAKIAPWHMTRMNLNTFLRHGVFESQEMIDMVAERLKNEELIRKSRVFPYQLLAAYKFADSQAPFEIREALQDALDLAVSNVPEIEGQVFVMTDVSSSMRSPVTGRRYGGTTAVRCVDVAALISAALLRNNKRARVLPFERRMVDLTLNPRDSVLTNAEKLSAIAGGGTNCSAPLAYLNKEKVTGDLIVYVSDNESWVDGVVNNRWNDATGTMKEWNEFKHRNPNAKMVCIDIQPNKTTQAKESPDIINVGGFSDQVFNLLASVASGEAEENHWVNVIEQVDL